MLKFISNINQYFNRDITLNLIQLLMLLLFKRKPRINLNKKIILVIEVELKVVEYPLFN